MQKCQRCSKTFAEHSSTKDACSKFVYERGAPATPRTVAFLEPASGDAPRRRVEHGEILYIDSELTPDTRSLRYDGDYWYTHAALEPVEEEEEEAPYMTHDVDMPVWGWGDERESEPEPQSVEEAAPQPAPPEPVWSLGKAARRIQLINRSVTFPLSAAERTELNGLTEDLGVITEAYINNGGPD